MRWLEALHFNVAGNSSVHRMKFTVDISQREANGTAVRESGRDSCELMPFLIKVK
jgi:hypothetical protein